MVVAGCGRKRLRVGVFRGIGQAGGGKPDRIVHLRLQAVARQVRACVAAGLRARSGQRMAPTARFAWLSIGAAVVTITLKTVAFLLTDSIGLLSDALESVVNLVAAIVTLTALMVAARPPDEDHAYGHTKAEYFASGLEGVLIFAAALVIGWAAVRRFLAPQPIEKAWLGLGVSCIASGVNFAVARVLLRVGKEHRSIALEADGHHLMTDVWTSAGVLVGVSAVALTGWERLDPTIALLVAANIVRTGARLVQRSALGLTDVAWTEAEQKALREVLARHERNDVQFHALRTRQAGARRFVSMHVLVPGSWTVSRGHELLEKIERDIRATFHHTTVDTHIEPLEDPASWTDQGLDRDDPPQGGTGST
jgi:cation diffusion facilitator family transporter